MICQYCLDLAGENERRKGRSYLRQANELRLRAEKAEAKRDTLRNDLENIRLFAAQRKGGYGIEGSLYSKFESFAAEALQKLEEPSTELRHPLDIGARDWKMESKCQTKT